MAKPDNRSDNVQKLQEMTQNTLENYREAENYLQAHEDEMNPQEAEQIREKNERRAASIEGFRNEIKDEAHDQHQT